MTLKNLSRFIVSVSMSLGALLPSANANAWGRFAGGFHPAYHRPVVVNRTIVRGGGCVGCGFAAGAVTGLVGGAIIGAAIAGSAAPPPPTTIVEQAPPQVVVVQGPPIGSQVSVLPAGCTVMNINGNNYYQCGTIWYRPYFGGGGVYYTVVPSP